MGYHVSLAREPLGFWRELLGLNFDAAVHVLEQGAAGVAENRQRQLWT